MKLHIVSFQVPYPPTYGGIVDVFYKLKALKEAGCRITLHTYRYDTDKSETLEAIADEVFYYDRYTGIRSQLSSIPYTIYSRRNKTLLERLCTDNAPILFEGLHTCFFLNHPRLQNRIRVVRTHNVEHDYYEQLAKATPSRLKHWYYRIEAHKLKQYEHNLNRASGILCITPEDQAYFNSRYPAVPTLWLPCFFNNETLGIPHAQETKPYILYHGNLSVDENIRAALFILNRVLPRLTPETHVIFAGKSPAAILTEEIKKHPQAEIIADPSEKEMTRLVAEARINLLLTFQRTGIKLKLIHALSGGNGHCLVNSPMLTDESLRTLCHVADTPEALARQIKELMNRTPGKEELTNRANTLQQIYNNRSNALQLMQFIESFGKTTD